MADGIEAGDLVRLKSGGPLMTVTRLARHDGVEVAWVSWFDKEQFAHNAPYSVVALTGVPAADASAAQEIGDRLP